MFNFCGEIQSSKSIFNRALIVQSYFPEIKINGISQSEDVLHLKNSIQKMNSENHFHAGMGGTTFRFLAIRLSRLQKNTILHAHPRLFERPQEDLWQLFSQLGVDHQISNNQLFIFGKQWDVNDRVIEIDCDKSTQFASAFLLNCWLLPYQVKINLKNVQNSKDYLEMTILFLQQVGMQIEISRFHQQYQITIPQNQKVNVTECNIEPDISSLATLAMAAVISGHAVIKNFPESSIQPDIAFLKYFDLMNIKYQVKDNSLILNSQTEYLGLSVNLQQTPDLFPCLAVLAAFAQTPSHLFGVPQLKHKESDRLKKTIELLEYLDCQINISDDGLKIIKPVSEFHHRHLRYNPDHDHRMAMAAGLIKLKKYDIVIEDVDVLNKSFPDFFELIGVNK